MDSQDFPSFPTAQETDPANAWRLGWVLGSLSRMMREGERETERPIIDFQTTTRDGTGTQGSILRAPFRASRRGEAREEKKGREILDWRLFPNSRGCGEPKVRPANNPADDERRYGYPRYSLSGYSLSLASSLLFPVVSQLSSSRIQMYSGRTSYLLPDGLSLTRDWTLHPPGTTWYRSLVFPPPEAAHQQVSYYGYAPAS